ncbi:MAG: substrate-binding domain-containing protein [Hyphomicrobiaceae bacterium]|nr:substrate-binding domain-containing protein [Hyphomicrobiaceae bacterium]
MTRIRAGIRAFTALTLLVGLSMLFAMAASRQVQAEAPFITVQSTTSTENSGLFAYLLPIFTNKAGIEVRVVAVGTGQAIKNARNGDADVLLVHARADEEKFVADGEGVKRYPLMYNDFVLVGPKADPATAAGSDVSKAFKAVADKKAPFISRGDDSGTHKAELAIWKSIGIDVKQASGSWYREAGQGMGATLNMASAMNGYVLSDRATWSAFNNRGELTILCQGDKRLHNPYGVILVNPAKHPHVKAKEGQAFIDWLVSAEGQAAIANFKINGEQQFFPAASD